MSSEKATLFVSENTDKATVEYIVSSFEEKLSRRIDFEVSVKPELLGGFIAKIDGITYDSSVASCLSRMKKYLMNR